MTTKYAKVLKWLGVAAFTFIGAFVGALQAQQGGTPTTWAMLASVLAGASLTGITAVVNLLMHPPSGPASETLATSLAAVEDLMWRRAIANGSQITTLVERVEKANAASLDTASMMVAHAVARHLATIQANSPPAVLKAMLDHAETVAASTPVEPMTPAPANDTTTTKESA